MRLLDPDDAEEYSARFTPAGTAPLELRGDIGVPMLGRTRIWQRD